MLLSTTLGVNTMLKKTSRSSTHGLCSFNVGVKLTFRLRSSCLSICKSSGIFKGGVNKSVLYGGGAFVLVGTLTLTSKVRQGRLRG